MPLLDHFHTPLIDRRDWHSFHHAWATSLAVELNRVLPENHFAAPSVQFGIELEVANFETSTAAYAANGPGTSSWSAPAPTATLPFTLLTDSVEVLVYYTFGGRILAAAIELVSPANKDRPAHRDAFVMKCAALLQQGLGLMIVDIVTERQADLHGQLLERISEADFPHSPADLYASSLRPVERDEAPALDLWYEPLQVGAKLPTLPLWLRDGLSLPVDLEAVYERTRRDLRLANPEH